MRCPAPRVGPRRPRPARPRESPAPPNPAFAHHRRYGARARRVARPRCVARRLCVALGRAFPPMPGPPTLRSEHRGGRRARRNGHEAVAHRRLPGPMRAARRTRSCRSSRNTAASSSPRPPRAGELDSAWSATLLPPSQQRWRTRPDSARSPLHQTADRRPPQPDALARPLGRTSRGQKPGIPRFSRRNHATTPTHLPMGRPQTREEPTAAEHRLPRGSNVPFRLMCTRVEPRTRERRRNRPGRRLVVNRATTGRPSRYR